MGVKQEMKQEAAAGAMGVVPYALKMKNFPSKRFNKICVFCGSSSGKKGVFSNEALNLGRELVWTSASKKWWSLSGFFMFFWLNSYYFWVEILVMTMWCFLNGAGEPEDRSGVWRRQYWPHGSSGSDGSVWRWSCCRVITNSSHTFLLSKFCN